MQCQRPFVPKILTQISGHEHAPHRADAEATTEGTIRLMTSRTCRGYDGTRFGYPSLGRRSKGARKARGSKIALVSGRGFFG
jgi:hypothetical protein